MYVNKDFRFRTTISKENYESKADAIACLSKPGSLAIGRNKMAWIEREVSIDDFMRLATSGYCFCNLAVDIELSVSGISYLGITGGCPYVVCAEKRPDFLRIELVGDRGGEFN